MVNLWLLVDGCLATKNCAFVRFASVYRYVVRGFEIFRKTRVDHSF
jgi:hypothetical protein